MVSFTAVGEVVIGMWVVVLVRKVCGEFGRSINGWRHNYEVLKG